MAAKTAEQPIGCEFPPAAMEKLAQIQQKLNASAETEVRGMIDIGRDVEALIDNKEQYGGLSFKRISDMLTTGRDTLRPCYVLARTYTDDELGQFFSLRNPETGAGLCRSHLAALSRVKNKAQAMSYAEEAVANGWSKTQLVAKIVEEQGGPSSAGGRKPKAAGTLEEILGQVCDNTSTWLNRESQVWRAAETGIDDQLLKLAKMSASPELIDSIDQTIALLETLADKAQLMEVELRDTLRRIRSYKKLGPVTTAKGDDD